MGIEEEFIVVNPETLWCDPGSFRLATGLIFSDSRYVRKCSVELPLQSGSFGTIVRRVRDAFCVVEIKTDPYEDIDGLRDELGAHRKHLGDCARDNNLWILPSGLHPSHRRSDLIDNCAALHVHLDYAKERYNRLLSAVPFLLGLGTNSPFLDGQIAGMSTRMMLSPHVNIPEGGVGRHADLIRNPVLGTVEVKVLDSQITLEESIGLASLVKAIGESNRFDESLSQSEYQKLRALAMSQGLQSVADFISEESLGVLADYNEYAKRKLALRSGALWQVDVFRAHGLGSVVSSLAASFEQDKRVVKPSAHGLDNNVNHSSNLLYIFPYLPFLIFDKYYKYWQDVKPGRGSFKEHDSLG